MLLAHSENYTGQTTESVTSSFPVYGNVQTASLAAVLVLLFAMAAYYFVSRVPLSKKQKLSEPKETGLAKIIAGLVIAAIASSAWDIWWHRAVGRDTLWELPHLFLYFFALAAILLSIYGWRHSHKKVWKRLAVVTGLILVSAPFDNLWHVLFRVEDLSRPISLSWSPPHVLLSLSTAGALLLLLPILKKDPRPAIRVFLTDLVFAAVLSMLIFLIMPFHPTEGWGQVLGFWGAGIFAAAWIGLVVKAQNYTHVGFTATRIMIYTLIFMFISYGKETAPGVIVLPHDRPPLWLPVFAYLAPAILLDLTKRRWPLLARSTLAAVLWAVILFGSATFFFAESFRYSSTEIVKAAAAAALGGLLVSLASHLKVIHNKFR